jgi:hypothetical protein
VQRASSELETEHALRIQRRAGAQEMALPEEGARSEAGTPTPNSKAPGGAPGAAPAPASETDQWVQCDRCRTWRVVPAQHWPSVEADTREVVTALCTSLSTAAALGHWQDAHATQPSSSAGPDMHGKLLAFEFRLLSMDEI